MSIQAGNLRRGNVIVHDGSPCRVLEYQHVKPGKGPAYMQAKLRNLESGVIFEHRFRAADTVERAAMQTRELQYLYSDSHHYHFMDTETFEQTAVDEDTLGDAAKWLVPNINVDVELYNGRPIGVELPRTMHLKVERTEPAMKGATASASTKPATLENGATIQVPPFIGEGETVIVDPREEKYLSRA